MNDEDKLPRNAGLYEDDSAIRAIVTMNDLKKILPQSIVDVNTTPDSFPCGVKLHNVERDLSHMRLHLT